MSTIIQENIILETIRHTCCGITSAYPDYYLRNRMENGDTFYCPNGHPRVFVESEVQKLKIQLTEAQRKLSVSQCAQLAEQAKREAAEKELTRHQKRTKNGVCPCVLSP